MLDEYVGRPATWPPATHEYKRTTVYVPMPDGVRLATDLYLPIVSGRVPCILARTPYGKRGGRVEGEARAFSRLGYAVAVQDVRGAYESEGVFSVSANEGADGDATVTWLASQGWCSGRIGSYGCSYLGESQLQLATFRNPHHVAMIAKACGGANTYFGMIDGGARGLQWGLRWFVRHGSRLRPHFDPDADPELLERTRDFFPLGFQPPPDLDFKRIVQQLPLVDLADACGAPPSEWVDFVAREPGDPWWESRNYVTDSSRFDVPTLMVESWYDAAVAPALRVHERMRDDSDSSRARDHQYVVISPTTHCGSESATEATVVGERELGDARFDHFKLYVRWFDHWLREEGEGLEGIPKVSYYLMGADTWKTAASWPPPDAEDVPLFLGSVRDARSDSGDGFLSLVPGSARGSDTFVADPGNPVPSLGGQLLDGSADPDAGGREQASVAERHDVLVYTSPPLAEGAEITGYLRLILYVSSDARDSDFAAKLVDVDPDGRAMNVQHGTIRARYRDGYERAVLMEPGATYRLEIDLHATSNYFPAGHRIRVQIAGSDFPMYDRNLNTGGDNARETEWLVATNVVHHGHGTPTQLVLPVVGGRLRFADPSR
jgi:putative CocE/NonD family hydrolase